MRISHSSAALCLLLLSLAGCGGGGGSADPGAGTGGNGNVGTPPAGGGTPPAGGGTTPPGGGSTPPGGSGTTPPPDGGSGGSSGADPPGGGSSPPQDTTPDVFAFTSQSNVARSAVITSNSITVTGIDQAVPVTITGADTCVASVNGGVYSATPGEIAGDQQLTVRVVSASQFATHRECSIRIGEGLATFGVTTGPGLALDPSSITLGGDDGLGAFEEQVVVTLLPPQGAHAYIATVSTTSGGSWLQLDKTSGSIGSTGDTITVRVDRASMTGGTYLGKVVFSAQVDGKALTEELPVQLNLPAHRLYVDDNGIGLATMPGLANLSGTVKVLDTYGFTSTPWSATSDQPWLSVTSSGVSGGELTVTANPAGLPTDTTHYATVTLTSSDASIQNQEKVRVGLWVGAAAAQPIDVSHLHYRVEADPIRPLLYVTNINRIDAYNIYTGALEYTLWHDGGGNTEPTISTDGSTLYVYVFVDQQFVPIDLDQRLPGMPIPSGNGTQSIAFARAKGRDLLITDNSGHDIFDLSTRTVVGGWGLNSGMLRVSPDGSTFCTASLLVNGRTDLYCRSLEYSEIRGGVTRVTQLGALEGDRTAGDLAVSRNGSLAYIASNEHVTAYDARTAAEVRDFSLQSPLGASFRNVEIGPTGKLYFGLSPTGGSPDTYVQDANGNDLGQLHIGDLSDRSIRISGDGLRVIARSASGFKVLTSP
jgi:Viral BACON domain